MRVFRTLSFGSKRVWADSDLSSWVSSFLAAAMIALVLGWRVCEGKEVSRNSCLEGTGVS